MQEINGHAAQEQPIWRLKWCIIRRLQLYLLRRMYLIGVASCMVFKKRGFEVVLIHETGSWYFLETYYTYFRRN